MKPKSLTELFPQVNYFLHRGLLAEPPMHSLTDILDGTLSIVDLEMIHEILDFKEHIKQG